MSIVIDEDTLAVFRIDIIMGNMLAAIRKDGDRFKITIRTRLEVDDKIWDSKDPKRWWEISAGGTLEDNIRKIRMILHAAPFRTSEVYEIQMDEDGPDEMARRIQAWPGMYSMTIPAKGEQH